MTDDRAGRQLRAPLAAISGLAVLVALTSGCSVSRPEASAGPTADAARSSPTHEATADPCPSPELVAATEPLPANVDEATREAIRLRTEYGLRRDLAWIRQVAADPTRSEAFGTPLLPAEEASLFARNELAPPVRAALDDYGHIDQLGGLYTDHAQGGIVVVLWTTTLEVHAAAIRAALPPCHPVAFRQVRWSEKELRTWQDAIAADTDWAMDIPAAIVGIGADITDNVVDIDVSSAAPDTAERIVAHYAAPEGMVRVRSDGTGAHLLPVGTVIGRVTRADGGRVGPNDLMLDAGSPDDPPGWCGGGDVGYGVLGDGTFEYPCKAGRRTILLRDWVPTGNGDHPIVASVVVEIPANGEVEVDISLPPGFDPAATP